ncbi:uncharacterized protein N0V89_009973 [Didymosphaeria variabile]|uniref:Uncharacterized protein n=1 Tax=Didymosphaeria variabile TaxID=1932322 RepID=A0A9W8XES5_9PLEO|nr:uncharacterized protein N0V89_009973 [Didymosphaeria variabile]KAJ4348595.1 hypothetical protein N0V89_009973 [Didymosphaeria variabile]
MLSQPAPSTTTEIHDDATPTDRVGQLALTPLETSAVAVRRAGADSISDEEQIAFEESDMHDLKGSLAGLQPDPRVHLPSQHVLEVLGVMDMPSFLIGRLHPSLGIWKSVRSLRSGSSDQFLGEIEVVTGMPRSLLDVFAEVADQRDKNQQAEDLFWSWRGCVGTFDQCHLWDSWRYAGILDSRRRLRCRYIAASPTMSSSSSGEDHGVNNEAVLCRLIASLDALVRKMDTAGELEPMFLNKGLVFPYTLASLEVPLLRANPLWKSTLTRFRSSFFYNDDIAIVDETVLELLEKAWEADTEFFDIDQAAREKGVELGIF